MDSYKLPKNIRQIGEKEDRIKIYLEDYVNTFIHRYQSEEERSIAGGILLGKKEKINGVVYLFIQGAMEIEDPLYKKSKDDKSTIQKIQRYFPDLMICGYFFYDYLEQVSKLQLIRVFEEHFQLDNQVLYHIHAQDEEFYVRGLEKGTQKLAGYAIYYEKNEAMQKYLHLQKEKIIIEQKRIDQEKIRGDTKKKQEIEYKIEDRKVKTKKGENMNKGNGAKMADIIVRTVSLVGIFLLAFFIFTDQISISQIDGTNNQAVESSTEAVKSVLAAESSLSTESEGGKESEQLSSEEYNSGEYSSEEISNEETSSEIESSNSETSINVVGNVSIPSAYTIAKGESIASISLKFYGTLDMVDKICEINGIDNPDYVQAGEKIELPK